MNEKETGMNSPRPAAPLKKKPPLKTNERAYKLAYFQFPFFTQTQQGTQIQMGEGGEAVGQGGREGAWGPRGGNVRLVFSTKSRNS